MNEKRMLKKIVMRTGKLVHLAVTVVMFLTVYYLFFRSALSDLEHMKADILVCCFYIILTFMFDRTYCAYGVGHYTVGDLIYSQTLLELITTTIIYFMISLVHMKLVNPIPLLVLLAAQFIWNALWSFIANKIYFLMYRLRKTAIVYGTPDDFKRLEEIRFFERKFLIEKIIENPTDYATLKKEITGIECICVSGIDTAIQNQIAKYCIENKVQGYFAPSVGDIIMRGAEHMRNFRVPMLSVGRVLPNPEYLFIKRLFDIVVSLIGIVILSPFMIITAIVIRLYDGGPALYKQVRLTKNGRKFKILKFRSMRVDAEKDGVARLASQNDDRITPIGKLIRAIRFDELPQLFNILKGDMSIVGPRPERPEIAAQYEETLPEFSLRLQVRAGLTGFAQVYGKYNSEPYDKLQFDLMYINKMSVVEDLKIMFATVKILFMKESTEGIADTMILPK